MTIFTILGIASCAIYVWALWNEARNDKQKYEELIKRSKY